MSPSLKIAIAIQAVIYMALIAFRIRYLYRTVNEIYVELKNRTSRFFMDSRAMWK